MLTVSSCALLLSGCGESTTPSETEPSTTAAVAWADGVCAASADLRASVRSGQTLQLAPAGSRASLDEARTQVRDRVAETRQSAAALNTAVTAVPPEAGAEVEEAQRQLAAQADDVRMEVDQLGTAADEVAAANSARAMGTALVGVKNALSDAAREVTALVGLLRDTTTGAGQSVRDAFGAAPACQKLDATPAPTSS
ncbi:hypothetical protein GCM10020369_10080 [Cryptosporangium minutisporangium]|uniref:Secreted protein n=1 Tax=Cryptosporangium minutisporangium TaxID=113569 RepID=A0ABP6SS58_9ACTN